MPATPRESPRHGSTIATAGGSAECAESRWTVRPAVAAALDRPDVPQLAVGSEAAFERLIADVSARFGNVPPEDVGATIDACLRMCTQALDMDRGTILQTAGGESLTVRCDCARPGLLVLPIGAPAIAHFPALTAAAQAGELVSYASVEAVANASERDSLRRLGTKSGLTIPLRVRGAVVGALCFTMHRHERRWTSDIVERTRLVAAVIAGALALERSLTEQRTSESEAQRLRARLAEEGAAVPRDATIPRVHRGLATDSLAIQRLLAQMEQVAPTTATVLLGRRDRHRQGGVRAGDPRLQPAPQAPDGPRQLRRDPGGAHRERAVRPREGRLHRRARAPGRAVRAGRRRHDLPRRDRRAAARGAGQAAARAAGARGRAARRHRGRSRSTCASSPPPTATSSRRSPTARSAKTSSTG